MADAAEFERHEGMLVRFQQPLYVSGNQSLGRFGELVLSPQLRLYHPNNHPELSPAEARDFNARSRLVLDDTRGIQNPAPIPFLSAADSSGTRRAGDVEKGLEGVLAFDFGAWLTQAVTEGIVLAVHDRPVQHSPHPIPTPETAA